MNVVAILLGAICFMEAVVIGRLLRENQSLRDLADDYLDLCNKALDFAERVLEGKKRLIDVLSSYLPDEEGGLQ